MSLRSTFLGTTGFFLLATTAHADVTSQQIWDDWKSYMSAFGYTVSGDESRSGDTLSIQDLSLAMDFPEGSADFTLGNVSFVDNGNGTVSMMFPETMPMRMRFAAPEGPEVSATLEYALENFNMQASGDPSRIVYDYTADGMGLRVTDLVVDGQTIGENVAKISFNSSALIGQSVMEPGALRKVVQNAQIGETTYTVNFADPASSDTFAMNGTLASMTMSGTTQIPAEIDPEDMAAAINDGFHVDGKLAYTGARGEFAVNDSNGMMGGKTGSETSQIRVRMGKDGLHYSGGSTGVMLDIAGGEIPLPVTASFGEVGFNLLFPIAKAEAPEDFALGLTFADFETSDLIWSLLDAQAILPRDPVTISFDLSGKAKMLVDFFDPETMEKLEDGESVPAELHAVTLNKLIVSAAGAKLTGDGDFTFDNTDLASFGGMPKPTGGINLQLDGGNGLMDKLVQMGLLPQEQAMTARMMMGLFARPGEGEDSLTSTIEINDEGHILANGQRIQ